MMALKPVVFIPGYPATELWYAPENWRIFPPSLSDLGNAVRKQRLIDLLCGAETSPASVVPGEPIRDVLGIAKQAASLYDILQGKFGYDAADDSTNFAHVGWDWRKGIDDPATAFAVGGAIERLSNANGGAGVVVIAHSTGGLVFRSVLESRPDLAARIDQVLAFGVPWAGTLKALHAIAVGDAEGILFWRITADEGRRIASHTQAAWDLAPPDPARTDMRDGDGTPLNLVVRDGRQTSALGDAIWIPAADKAGFLPFATAADARLGQRSAVISLPGGEAVPPITNMVGWGTDTLAQCDIHDDGSLAFSNSPAKLGDGTVPLVSASWLRGDGVRTLFLPIGVYPIAGVPFVHARIWDSPPVLQIFSEVLRDRPRSEFVCAAADADDAIDPDRDVRIRICAAAADGTPLPQCVATLKPMNGQIRISFNASTLGAAVVQRVGLSPNIAHDLYRFEIDVRWSGGKTTVPVLIHTS
jgi:Lecithin:cholesterol acyltransferase